MAVLEKIRVKFGLAASIIIALGLLSFIVSPDDLARAFQNMSSKYDVGRIAGKDISYADFQEEVQKFTEINEVTTGGAASSAQQQEQIRDAAWQSLVYKNLFNKNARAAGIQVGEEELVDLTSGTNISSLIAQNPAFFDQTGTFSKDLFMNFIQNVDSDPSGRLRLYWNNLQESIMNQQYFEKYNSLFTRGIIDNPLMLKRQIAENNNTYDVDFVLVPMAYQADSTIQVTDGEIRSYYKNHKKFYRQPASRDIEYAVFEVTPSPMDIEANRNAVAELVEEFASTDNVKAFLLKNSDRPFDEKYYKEGELRSSVASAVEDFVWEGQGAVSEILSTNEGFMVARVMDTRMIPDSAYVRHIMLQGANADAQADSLFDVIKKGADFAQVAAAHSADQGSADGGERGNIGWMTQNYMIPGFESVLTAETKKPFILKTQYGTHIVEVVRKSAPVLKKQVAVLEKETLASKETFNDFYNRANHFATAAAGSYENYKKAVDTLGVYSHVLNGVREGADRYGGIENAKEVTRWIFDNKPGKVSGIITVDNNYFFVTTVKAIHKEGYATVNEVAGTIRDRLYFEKQSEKQAAAVAEQVAGLTDLEAIAEKFGTAVSSQSGVSFSAMGAQGLDPKFIGAIPSAPEGVLCGPVAGAVGTYYYKVTGHDNGSFFTEDDARDRNAQMNQYATQMIIPMMMQEDDTKDNRARFF